jgi:hypothetical protein
LGSHNGGWLSAPSDYFTEEDLDEATSKNLPLDLKKRFAVLGKKRLLFKQPGFSLKIKYLNAIFPDAIFVHCLRNPIDTFHSLVTQKIKSKNSNWGLRIPDWQQFSHLSIDAQAAHQLARTHEIIQQSIHQLGNPVGRYVTVRYEGFDTAYAAEVQKLFHGCELEAPAAILQNTGFYVPSGGGSKKRRELPTDPVAREILEKLCDQMGYENPLLSQS